MVCKFDDKGVCRALVCYDSTVICTARDENGFINYGLTKKGQEIARRAIPHSEIDWNAYSMPDGNRIIATAQLHRIRTEAMADGARQERERIRAAVEKDLIITKKLSDKPPGLYASGRLSGLDRVLAILDPKEAE